jgi:hypothetical protein
VREMIEEEVLSIAIIMFSLILSGVSFTAYIKIRLKKFVIVSIAFLLFAVREFIKHIDIIYPDIEASSLGLTAKLIDFIILFLFFLAIIIKETKKKKYYNEMI